MKIKDLYFGIVLPDKALGDFTRANLFGSRRVQRSIAVYIDKGYAENPPREDFDPLYFCFGDTHGRVEYEFLIKPWASGGSDSVYKVDVWTMFVKPNGEHLMELVNSVSKEDAKKWLEVNK